MLDAIACTDAPTTSQGVPLWAKPWLTIPEAMRLTRKGRAGVLDMIESKRWIAIQEGKRLKIATKSIRDDVTAQMEAVREKMAA